ncbi:MAG TPA: cohesin domain-containing protein [Verrucomicrobiae bacterium]|nr:cohesin domain-containing protein [Verrucomicrobiae bacterium]
MDLAKIKRVVLWVAVLVGFLGFGQSASAATGTIYLAPAITNLTNGAEVSMALRINPGVDVNGVQAEITYDGSKLQLVSASDAGSAFPEIAEQNVAANPISLTRTTSGNTVNVDSLIITLRFKAVAASGSTTISLTGNAAQGTTVTSPGVQGATVTFSSSSSPAPPSSPTPPTPSGGSSTRQQNQSTPQPEDVPDVPGAVNQLPGVDQLTNDPQPLTVPDPRVSHRIWWLFGVLGVIVVLGGAYWLIRRHRSTPAELAADHPIDRTWATPPVHTEEDEETDELLSHIPGTAKPDPGSIITPKAPPEKK